MVCFFAVVTILMMGLMSILRQSSPWWQGSTSTFTGQWMRMAFMKVWHPLSFLLLFFKYHHIANYLFSLLFLRRAAGWTAGACPF